MAGPVTDFKLITAAAMAAQAGQLSTYERLLEIELNAATLGECYEVIFSRLLKPDPLRLFAPEAGETLMMQGTDQREFFVPFFIEGLKALPPGGKVLDLGCGDGQSLALVLAEREAPLSIVPLDPNQAYLEQYQVRCAAEMPQVTIPYALEGSMEALLGAGQPDERFDAVLTMHSLHFAEDPQGFLDLVLDRLKPGGRWLIVVISQMGGTANALLRDYAEAYGLDPDGRIAARHAALDDLLWLSDPKPDAAALTRELQAKLGRDDFQLDAIEPQPSRIFGHDFGDLISICLITGILQLDEDRARQIRFVSERLRQQPESYDLRVELTGPRARMLSFLQPQTVLQFRRL